MVLILIGPAGAGKSTIGRALSAQLGWPFLEREDGAELHRAAARALDRRDHLIVACRCLTARARQSIRGDLRVRFVFLHASRPTLEDRVTRCAHATTTADLHAQLLELEDPGDEALAVDANQDVTTVAGTIRREIGF